MRRRNRTLLLLAAVLAALIWMHKESEMRPA